MPLTLTTAADDDGRRLDRILRKALRNLPLSAIHRFLRQGAVLVDGKKADADYRVKSGQIIIITGIDNNDLLQNSTHIDTELQKTQSKIIKSNLSFLSPMPLCEKKLTDIIIFEGAGLLILNKPEGVSVHGRDSLENHVLSYLGPKLPPSLSFRPGPLHRLDKPSSGIITYSTNLEGARFFSALLRERKITKQYLVILEGVLKNDEVWQDELSRDHEKKKTFTSDEKRKFVRSIGQSAQTKIALTKVTPLASNSVCTLILAEIETGRTHQIRAQAAAHGHPLLGDRKYGGKPLGDIKKIDNYGFLLHAWRMEFPETTVLPQLIEAPLPERFRLKIRELFGEWGSG